MAYSHAGSTSAGAGACPGSEKGAAVRPLNAGALGVARVTAASSSASARRAGSICGEWNAPVTSSSSARRPRPRASRRAASTASCEPASTSWPGALSLATTSAWSSASWSACSGVPPSTASMVPPGRRSAACAISSPRTTASRTAAVSVIAPAAARAGSSPSEWPANVPPSGAPRPRHAARLASTIAGWAKRVLSPQRGNGFAPAWSTTMSSRSGASSRTNSSCCGSCTPWPGKR